MTGLLASVQDAREMDLAIKGGADWIDLKNPKAGALGMLPATDLADLVRSLDGRLPVSATLGDHWDDPSRYGDLVGELESVELSYIKVGVNARGLNQAYKAILENVLNRAMPAIAVIVVEFGVTNSMCRDLADLGFKGAMLDTADKTSGALGTKIGIDGVRRFVESARDAGLLCGLAGSLDISHLSAYLPLTPDYLGFRSALCQGSRTGTINQQAVRELATKLHSGDCQQAVA
ncbi:MAG: (5-formylfuran-3-yl)methyl phosphate synthase [Pseudomonadota bacterium]